MHDPADRPAVVVFPPVLMAFYLVAMIVLQRLWPLYLEVRGVAFVLGLACAVAGLVLIAWGRSNLVRGGTNVSPARPTTTVVTAGPYRFTRNPLYVGGTAVLLGLSLCIGTWWGIVILAPVLLVLHYGIVLREERYLEEKFGLAYLGYKRAVRRYL